MQAAVISSNANKRPAYRMGLRLFMTAREASRAGPRFWQYPEGQIIYQPDRPSARRDFALVTVCCLYKLSAMEFRRTGDGLERDRH